MNMNLLLMFWIEVEGTVSVPFLLKELPVACTMKAFEMQVEGDFLDTTLG